MNYEKSDSVREYDNHPRIHSRSTGKLHKGHGMVAASTSIPTKYQTLVTSNIENKGFSSQAKRFSSDVYMTDTPGPGNYHFAHGDIEKHSVSFSKKGTGGLASKASRSQKSKSIPSPGAASYTLPSLLSTRKEFNRSTATSGFQHPIAVNTDHLLQGPRKMPAPNQYNVQKVKTGKKSVVTAQAAFNSKTKREGMPVGKVRVPSPSHYNIQTHTRNKGPMSSFHSQTKRDILQKPNNFPGPGSYKPHESLDPISKQLFPRKHYLCLSAPAMALPPTLPNPGPGAYEVVDYEGPSKHYMSSGVFVSNTSRWNLDHLPTRDFPGPSTYRPEKNGRQSFLFNAQNRWVPC